MEQPTVHLRLVWEQLGGHIHCTFSSGLSDQSTHGVNDTLTFDEREWPRVKEEFEKVAEVKKKVRGTL